MSGFLSQYGASLTALLVLYPMSAFALTFLPIPENTDLTAIQIFLQRFISFNFAAGIVATCGPSIIRHKFGPGAYEPFGGTLVVLTQSAHPFNSLPGLLVLLNALLFVPAGFLAAFGGWSVRRTAVTSLKFALGIEIAQLVALGGAASVDDLLLNCISGLIGVVLGKAALGVWSRFVA